MQHVWGTAHACNECMYAVQIRTADPEADFRLGEMLTEFPISGYHYFCETVDITRPFPSSHSVTDPSWEFVWNYYLTQPFRRVGLGAVAPHMLQGLAEQRSLPDLLGKLFSVVLIARRSRLHAGTRYAPPHSAPCAAPSACCCAVELPMLQLLLGY